MEELKKVKVEGFSPPINGGSEKYSQCNLFRGVGFSPPINGGSEKLGLITICDKFVILPLFILLYHKKFPCQS